MLRIRGPSLGVAALLVIILASAGASEVYAWSNGSYSTDPTQPKYGTHDWIAQHALDWLPTQEKQFLTGNLASYLYGTELPDNAQAADGVGDTGKHHIYFSADGVLQDDASAVRAQQEYANAKAAYMAGNFSAAAEHLGMVAHYVSDVAVFGHVMGTSTPWGAEKHHSDYEDHVLTQTDSYQSSFTSYLAFDGALNTVSAHDAAVSVANDTTFDHGGALTCTWMDTHYDWSNPTFKNRAGESLNTATNAVADVLHTFYLETTTTTPEFPAGAVLAAMLMAVSTIVFVLTKKGFRKK